MAALEGPFPTLEQMAVFPDAWPAGQVPYLFGESFLRHLAGRSRARGGRRDQPRLRGQARCRSSSGRPAGRRSARTTATCGGSGPRRCARASGSRSAPSTARGVTRAAALTADGRVNLSPAWSPDGARIAWLRDDGGDYPGRVGHGRRRLGPRGASRRTTSRRPPRGRRSPGARTGGGSTTRSRGLSAARRCSTTSGPATPGAARRRASPADCAPATRTRRPTAARSRS